MTYPHNDFIERIRKNNQKDNISNNKKNKMFTIEQSKQLILSKQAIISM